jgi:hypothetical protein
VADLSSFYSYQQALQVLTREGFITKSVIDTYFKAKKFAQYLRQRDRVVEEKGSLALTWPINVGSSPNTTTFDGDDDLPIASLQGNLYRPSLKWARYTDALSIPLTELSDNNGSKEAIANLLDVQLDITKMSLLDRISTDMVVNTNAIDPKGLNGLAEAIDDGTVAPYYANLSRAALGAQWKSQTNYVIPVASSANLTAQFHTLDLQASQDGSRPDAYFANLLVFGQLIQSLFPQDRYLQPEMARTAGGNDYVFNGNPFFLDTAVPTGVVSPSSSPPSGTNSGGIIYGVNSTYMKLVVNPAFNFEVMDWQIGQNNLTLFTRLLWFANLADLKPSAHWVAWAQSF